AKQTNQICSATEPGSGDPSGPVHRRCEAGFRSAAMIAPGCDFPGYLCIEPTAKQIFRKSDESHVAQFVAKDSIQIDETTYADAVHESNCPKAPGRQTSTDPDPPFGLPILFRADVPGTFRSVSKGQRNPCMTASF